MSGHAHGNHIGPQGHTIVVKEIHYVNCLIKLGHLLTLKLGSNFEAQPLLRNACNGPGI